MSLKLGDRVSLSGSPISLSRGLAVALLSVLVGGTASAQTLNTLTSFNGSNGSAPFFGSLVSDATGNLFGTTSSGGANGYGAVFEIPKTSSGYAAAPVILASFDNTDGANPYSGLIIDSAGDLFGTTNSGGSSGQGTVFEIANTTSGYASAPTTLVNFDGNNGGYPTSGLVTDSSGNLFGTTEFGGISGVGTVFEIAKTTSGYNATSITLVSFDGTNGELPIAGLIVDSSGNLFGTTESGGTNGYGTVFEVSNSTNGYDSAPITLASFDGANGENPFSSLITDNNGDLFGTTESGGASGDGTVFEVVNTTGGYNSTPVALASFDGSNGANPFSGLIADANGNIFGTTDSGGASGDGTVFEIANTTSGYAGTPATVISFDGADGVNPYSGLIADANGNLYGTASSGGDSNDGTVFDLSGSGFVPPKQFAGTPGTPNCVGESTSVLARTYGGIAHAASSLGYAGVTDLKSAITNYCSE